MRREPNPLLQLAALAALVGLSDPGSRVRLRSWAARARQWFTASTARAEDDIRTRRELAGLDDWLAGVKDGAW